MGFYSGTIFDIIPNNNQTVTTERTNIPPAFICCISSDKGPEGLNTIEGEEFYNLYIRNREVSFEKHGQPLLQAANIIDNGGIGIINRVVAENSTLANLVLWGVVKTAYVQKTDENGAKLYKDTNTGEETTSATSVVDDKTVANDPVMIKQTKVSYETNSFANVTSMDQVRALVNDMAIEASKKVIVTDEENISSSPIAISNAAILAIDDIVNAYGDVSSYANANVSAVKYADNTLYLGTADGEVLPYVTAEKGFDEDTKNGNFIAFRITLPEGKDTTGLKISMTGINNGPWGPEVLTENKYLDVILNIANRDSTTATFTWNDGTTSTYTVNYAAISKEKADGTATTPTPVEIGEHDASIQKFPIYAFTDNGRGVSEKRIRIYPDNRTSKGVNYMLYNLDVIEGTKTLESLKFCSDYNIIRKNENMSIQTVTSTYSSQVKSYIFTKYQDQFVETVAESVGATGNDIGDLDFIFGTSRNGKYSIDYVLDKGGIKKESTSLYYDLENGVNISYAFGLSLENGGNGDFGDHPWGTEAYFKQVYDFFTDANGSGEIFDVDNIKPAAIIDANYPFNIKQAIEKVVKFREDCFFFRDLGLGLKTKDDIYFADLDNDSTGVDADLGLDEKDGMFCGTYHMSYDVIDPHTKRQITVTACYSLSKLLPGHFINGPHRPICGQLYGMILKDAIPGTINFIPRVKPGCNDKEDLDDHRINYAGLEDGLFVLESDWTSITSTTTEYAYIHNVLAVQEVIRAIRRRCPKKRYTFLTAEDLTAYKNDVQEVLDKFAGRFKTLRFEYIEDKTMVQNKVFYAAIYVQFNNFIRTEYFKIYELENDGTIS